MDWPSLYGLVLDAAKIPLLAAVGGGFVGAGINQWLTQKREREKLLREKAEALIFLLHQSRHKMTTWYLAIEHQAEHAIPSLAERPTTLLLDLDQAYALGRLYFPAVDLEALEDALIPLAAWLENQWDQQHRDFQRWREQFCRDERKPLDDAYYTACEETIAAVVRTIPQSQKFARALARLRRHQ